MEAKTLITAEELLNIPESDKYELVKGELVEMPPVGDIHGYIVSMSLGRMLANHVIEKNLGLVLTEVGFHLRHSPDTVRAPDVAFVSSMSPEEMTGGFINVPPDLVVEVVSPNDKADELSKKVTDYIDEGVKLIWVVYPDQRKIETYYKRGSGKGSHQFNILTEKDTLSGEDVVPGFYCVVSEIFK